MTIRTTDSALRIFRGLRRVGGTVRRPGPTAPAARRAGSSSRQISSSQPCAHSAVRTDCRCVVMMVRRRSRAGRLGSDDEPCAVACGRTCRRAHHPRNCTPRVGHLALAVGRSWSNALSASAGIVAIIGGPLRTGRRRAIDQVLRTTAPMHDGFAGGGLVDTTGALLGVITSTRIRGTTVVIPASIAWKTASSVLEHGGLKRGYLGIAGHGSPPRQSFASAALPTAARRDAGLLVAAVTPESPAAAAPPCGRHHSGAGCEPDRVAGRPLELFMGKPHWI